jgi:hypothetical protein
MESTWETRDLPVLESIVYGYDETGVSPTPTEIAETCGLNSDEVQRALRALQHTEPSFVTKMAETSAGIVLVGAPTGHARRVVGSWPTPDALADRIIAALAEAAEAESDPDTKGRLKRAADAVGGVGKSVLTGVLTHVITQGM